MPHASAYAILALGLSFLAGCEHTVAAARPPVELASVTGSIKLPESWNDPWCRVTVQLRDLNGETPVLAEQQLENLGSPPYRFELSYPPSRIRPNGRYEIAAVAIRHRQPPVELTHPADLGQSVVEMELAPESQGSKARSSGSAPPRTSRRTPRRSFRRGSIDSFGSEEWMVRPRPEPPNWFERRWNPVRKAGSSAWSATQRVWRPGRPGTPQQEQSGW